MGRKAVTPEQLIEQTVRQSPGAVATTPKSVELTAEAAGNMVLVTVINHTDKPLLVGPKFFAAIIEGTAHPADSRNVMGQFPVRSLRREEGASGTFQFHRLASLEGQKLALKSPDAEAQYVIINRYQPRQPNYRPTPQTLSPREARRLEREQQESFKALREQLQKQNATAPQSK